MPIYEFRCDGCGASFEKFYRAAAPDAGAACPSCGQPGRRTLSAFATPRGAAPGPDSPEHPAPPEPAGGHGHGHSHGPGGHSH